jgi:alpha-beta hydrolase superfamily lysophospholipase
MEQFNICAKDSTRLNGYFFPVNEPKALIILIHGMGEHAMRYEHVALFMNKMNIAVMTLDLRGHGTSAGKRGHTPNYEMLMSDLDQFLDYAKTNYPSIPIVLYGHSMGGNLALNFLIRRQPEVYGAIVTAPYLKLAFEPPAWKVSLGKLTAGIIPTLTQPTGLETAAISKDPEEVRKYELDPLVHDKITSSFFVNVHFAGPYAIENAGKIKIPLLVMHGLADRLTSPKGTEEFAKNANSTTTVHYWPELYHELHNEPEKNEVLQFEADWLKSIGLC